MIHEEARVEVALDHARTQVVDAPRASSASTHSSNHLIQIEAGLVAIEQTLTHTNLFLIATKKNHHHGGNQNLVHHLGVLTAASTSHVLDVGSHALPITNQLQRNLEQGNHIIEHVLISAHHDAQLAVASTDITSRHRGVEAVEALLLAHGIDLLSERRLAGGHIHVDAALLPIRRQNRHYLQTLENTLLTESDLSHIRGVTTDYEKRVNRPDNAENNIGTLRNLNGALRQLSTLRDEGIALAQGTVVLKMTQRA